MACRAAAASVSRARRSADHPPLDLSAGLLIEVERQAGKPFGRLLEGIRARRVGETWRRTKVDEYPKGV